MRSLWNRARQLVSGSRRGDQQLRLAVDELPAHPYHEPYIGIIPDRYADDVLRLLHRDEPTAPSGPRPVDTESVGLGPLARTVSGAGDASRTYTYRYEPAQHSTTNTLGGWTVTTSIDCE